MTAQRAAERKPARSKRAPAPEIEHETARVETRVEMRPRNGPTYEGRDGEILTRKNPNYRNEFDFQPHEVPAKYVYQWIRHTVHGDPSESEVFDMMENGWRPVPHSRHATRFAPTFLEGVNGKNACITRKGQLLMERPLQMNIDAQRDVTNAANEQIAVQFGSHGLAIPDAARATGIDYVRNAEARQYVRPPSRHTKDVETLGADMAPKYDREVDLG